MRADVDAVLLGQQDEEREDVADPASESDQSDTHAPDGASRPVMFITRSAGAR